MGANWMWQWSLYVGGNEVRFSTLSVVIQWWKKVITIELLMSNKGLKTHYKISGVHLHKCIIMNQLHIHGSYNLF
jgi:hypothetical protein